jgi:hypothetical protein
MTPYQLVYGKTYHHPEELEHKAFWAIKKWNGTKLPSLRNGGRKSTIVPSYTRKEPKDGTTSESRSSNSSREIRYFFLTLVFVCLVMVSFVASGKARI